MPQYSLRAESTKVCSLDKKGRAPVKGSVLVLGAQSKASVQVIESCARFGLHVIAGASSKRCCGLYSKATSERFVHLHPLENEEKCRDILLDFIVKRNVTVLYPVDGITTALVARYQEDFAKHTRFVLPAYDVFVRGNNKISTLKAAEQAGCAIPRTWYPEESSLDDIAARVDYPLLIKPAVSAGARGIVRCNNTDELLHYFPQVQQAFGLVFVQEFVPPGGGQQLVNFVVDQSQQVLAAVTYEKVRFYPPAGGSAVLARTVYLGDVTDSATCVLRELKWVGFCSMDFITDPRDGVAKLMEINPRYPESFRATVAAGVDMVKIICQLALGEPVQPQLDFRENQYARFLFGDIMWFIRTKENRWKTKPSFFKFFGDDIYYFLFRKNDPGPVLGHFIENLPLPWKKDPRKKRLKLEGLGKRRM